MNVRVLAVAVGTAVVAGGAVLIFLSGGSRPAAPDASTTATSGPSTSVAGREAGPPAPAGEPRAGVSPGPRRSSPGESGATEAPAASAAEPAPVAGLLRIDSDVPGAQVFIDRRYIGTTPVTAENLSPGTHQLNVSAEGFDGIARTIEVEAGASELVVRFREVRLDLRLPVVHRHRMGSCNGTLVATPQGLRYETDDMEDRFAASFADLEAFQVDYTEKNLRVRVRKGKQYNFTDPEGNADKLFVFHRDVDKARQRLSSGATAATD
jgi:hypothetical protein